MKLLTRALCVGVVTLGALWSNTRAFAAPPATPAAPERRSESSQSVQKQVDKKSADEAIERRKKIFADATDAIAETQRALKALEEKKKDEALNALALATGKLELILARDPKLALAPMATDVVTRDLLANPETIKLMIKEAKDVENLVGNSEGTTVSVPMKGTPVPWPA